MNTTRRSNCSRRANLVLFLFRFRAAACCFPPMATPASSPPLCFSLCHCHKDKVDRSLDRAEKSYHGGRHSSSLQEENASGYFSSSPSASAASFFSPLFFYAPSGTRVIIGLLLPSRFVRSIIPAELGFDRLRSIEDRGSIPVVDVMPAETVHVQPLVCEMACRRDLISDSVFTVPLLR